MKKIFSHVPLPEMKGVASYLATLAESHSVFAFYGQMGAGKTTLIGELVRNLVNEKIDVTSPTFALVNVYEGNKNVYHFDCYRLESPEEALNAGLDEMIYDGTICLIEWPEKIAVLLPKRLVEIHITASENESFRNVEIIITDHD